MPRLLDLPEHERPRERLACKGANALSDAELLALVLGTGTRTHNVLSVAHYLLAAGSLDQLTARSLSELASVSGVGSAKAARLVAAFELGRRALVPAPPTRTFVKSPQDVLALLRPRLLALGHEQLEGVYVDSRGRMLATRTLAQGNLNTTLVGPREVFTPALQEKASAVILVHNHPSGDPTPSEADVEFTRLMDAAGELFGVGLVDHLIVGTEGWRSLRKEGAFGKVRPFQLGAPNST